MDPRQVADLFASRGSGMTRAIEYLKEQGVFEMLRSISGRDPDRIPPDYRDLARLHSAIRARKVFTVLEFGLGFSTIVMADALARNSEDWKTLVDKPRIRNSTPFQLHSVDTSELWLESTRGMIPENLSHIVTLHHSEATAGCFHDRACHFYENIPDVVADLIYLDGPDPSTVSGQVGGLSWSNTDRVVTSGDLLRMEPQLLPGTLLMVDGRTANVRFLAHHFFRNWRLEQNAEGDVSALELQEAPLGSINESTLRYSLGDRVLDWSS